MDEKDILDVLELVILGLACPFVLPFIDTDSEVTHDTGR